MDRWSWTATSTSSSHPAPRINILTNVDGIDFDECWERRVEIAVGGRSVPFLSVDDLVANKKASGRPQDLADALILERQLDDT